jgi:hypothetical protein
MIARLRPPRAPLTGEPQSGSKGFAGPVPRLLRGVDFPTAWIQKIPDPETWEAIKNAAKTAGTLMNRRN